MVELSTRDLLVLYSIIEWNTEAYQGVRGIPNSAKASAMQPCTVTVLVDGYVNTIAKRIGVNDTVNHSEQVYRSIEILDKAGLVCIVQAGKRHQYTSTTQGRRLINKLGSGRSWPNKVSVDGNDFHIHQSLAARE